MENFKDIEDALAAQICAQAELINANNHKGDALDYAKEGEGIQDFIFPNVRNLIHADNPEDARKAGLNVLNYTLFFMINQKLL